MANLDKMFFWDSEEMEFISKAIFANKLWMQLSKTVSKAERRCGNQNVQEQKPRS